MARFISLCLLRQNRSHRSLNYFALLEAKVQAYEFRLNHKTVKQKERTAAKYTFFGYLGKQCEYNTEVNFTFTIHSTSNITRSVI
jgi:hypothetical protein